jgi:MFS family permease
MLFWVKEPSKPANNKKNSRLHWSQLREFGARYWVIVALGAVFTLARFSEAFLILRAQDSGIRIGLVPVVLIVMNLVYMLVAYPAGAASDRGHPRAFLLGGLAALIVSDLLLAYAPTSEVVLAGAGVWGLHMALTQGTLSKLVADTAPDEYRGTAFGIFNLITGISSLFASLIAGDLWSSYGPAATFLAGAGFSCLAAISLLIYNVLQAPRPGKSTR